MIQTSRRGFLGLLLAAPVIVKATSLMAVKPVYASGGLISAEHPWGGPILHDGNDLTQAELERVLIEIRRNTRERRLVIGDSPRLLVVPPNLLNQARRLVLS